MISRDLKLNGKTIHTARQTCNGGETIVCNCCLLVKRLYLKARRKQNIVCHPPTTHCAFYPLTKGQSVRKGMKNESSVTPIQIWKFKWNNIFKSIHPIVGREEYKRHFPPPHVSPHCHLRYQ